MNYTCQNCGGTADNTSSLCNPVEVEFENRFFGVPADHVYEEKISAIKYVCGGCGSMSADADHLCDPDLIRH